jgi:hypothetical protein
MQFLLSSLAVKRQGQPQPSLSFLVPKTSTDNTPFLVLVSTVCSEIKILHILEDRMRAVRAQGGRVQGTFSFRSQSTGTRHHPFKSPESHSQDAYVQADLSLVKQPSLSLSASWNLSLIVLDTRLKKPILITVSSRTQKKDKLHII